MSTVQINTAFNVGLDFEIAPFHKRLLAYVIDLVILVIYLYAILYFLADHVDITDENSPVFRILLLAIPMYFYSLITEVLMNGQTIGKRLLKIRVISLEGGEPSLGQFVLRSMTKFFEWPLLLGPAFSYGSVSVAYFVIYTGFLGIAVVIIVLATKKNQRLGDMIADTAVVSAKTFMSVHDTIFINVNTDNYQVSFPEVMRLSDNDINTVKSVLTQAQRMNNLDICMRVEYKIKEVLGITSSLPATAFLSKLLEDYNYLATKE